MTKLWHKQFWKWPVRGVSVGLLFNHHAFWIGWHYSRWNRRVCVNVLPCVTVWVCAEGGIEP